MLTLDIFIKLVQQALIDNFDGFCERVTNNQTKASLPAHGTAGHTHGYHLAPYYFLGRHYLSKQPNANLIVNVI